MLNLTNLLFVCSVLCTFMLVVGVRSVRRSNKGYVCGHVKKKIRTNHPNNRKPLYPTEHHHPDSKVWRESDSPLKGWREGSLEKLWHTSDISSAVKFLVIVSYGLESSIRATESMFNGCGLTTNTIQGKIPRRPTIMESNTITKIALMKGKTMTFQRQSG